MALGFALQPVSYSLQSWQRLHPNSSNLDGYTLRQNWSANLYSYNGENECDEEEQVGPNTLEFSPPEPFRLSPLW